MSTTRSWSRMAASLMLLLGAITIGLGVVSPAQAAGVISVEKTNDLSGTLTPGEEFKYTIVVKCTSITEDCIDFQLTDAIPDGLEITSVPGSVPGRLVNQSGNTLTVDFAYPLDFGEVGIGAGDTYTISVGVRLPHDTQVLDGTTLSNTAHVTADGSTPDESTSEVVVEIPRVVTPVATKTWSDGSGIAGTDEESTITLGVRNASSSSAEVSELSVRDETPATFEHFDFTGEATLATLPAGAATATLRVKLADGGWVEASTINGPGPFTLPGGIDPADVIGVEVVFRATDGQTLPYDASGGKVQIGMRLRDTERSTDDDIAPSKKLTVTNCAVPSAVDAELGSVSGADACRNYDILPDIVVLTGSKNFFADTDGNWAKNNGEHAVLGENSPVTAVVNVKNDSPFPLATVTIVEPDPDTTTEFDKLDVQQVRLRFPANATTASVVVTFDGGSSQTFTRSANGVIEMPAGKVPTRIETTYQGLDENGDPAIQVGSTAGIDLHGTLNDGVTTADLPGGTSPNIANCAGYTGSDGRPDGSGTASGSACKDLVIEQPSTTSTGVKTVGQTSVPPGQPIPFKLTVTNNGNKPLVSPVITDPQVDTNGVPVAPNPFESLRITAASISKSANTPGVSIELYVPGTGWVAYAAGDPALLESARGIRASMAGNLTPTRWFTLNLVTERRPGVSDEDLQILNCFTTTAGGDYVPGNPSCSPAIEVDPASAAASLNKAISPGTLPEYVPGLPAQYADVTLTVRNTGNMSAKYLELTDADADFFDSVDFAGVTSVKLPAGANRVIVSVLQDGVWLDGPVSTNGALHADADPTKVRGIRVRYVSTDTSTNDGFVITPCAVNSCDGNLVFKISPRQTKVSDGSPVDTELENTIDGEFLTPLQDPDDPKAIPETDATLELVPGDPQLRVEKSQNAVVEPGEVTDFNLVVENTGTTNITDLVVRDLLPKGIALDDAFAGDNGLPYTMVPSPATQVPAGTPAVPTPEFAQQNGNDRVEGLTWDFSKDADGNPWVLPPGGRITLQIWVTLEPGVASGEVVTNTMGAHGSNPEFECRPGGTSQTDGPFGDGEWCTDTADLTAKEGTAFQARKWDRGNDDLGWWNTRTKRLVDVADSSCPILRKNGDAYTRYPCVAMVNPGDQHHYLLRVVNAGTTEGTEIRMIDELPHVGDVGAIGGEDRGTQWDQRPTLASRPAASANAQLVTSYTDEVPVCFDDLDMSQGAAQCAAEDWDAPFSASADGFKLVLTPTSGTFAPGETVDITFTMDTPIEVTQVDNPTIAWNSIAHAERAQNDAGGEVLLPPTEPLKVGVGLAYGTLDLSKVIGENPSNLALLDETFEFRARCVITPIGGQETVVLNEVYQVSPNTPVSVDGLPAGAQCRIWEVDARGGVTDHDEDHPVEVTITPNFDGTTMTASQIENSYPDTVIELRKTVTGEAAGFAPDTFEAELTCRDVSGTPLPGFDPKTVTLRPGQENWQASVPAGSICSAVETESGSATAVNYDPAGGPGGVSGEVTTSEGAAQVIGIENVYRAGSLVINKEVTGFGTPELAQGPFVFAVDCGFNGVDSVVHTSVTVPEGTGTQTAFQSEPLTGLPAGAVCTVEETDNGGADATPAPITVTIVADDEVVAGFVAGQANEFSAGTIGLQKVLTGAAAASDLAANAEFTVAVTCQVETLDPDGATIRATVYSAAHTIKGGETIDPILDDSDAVVKLAVGTHCWGEETQAGGATESTVDLDSWENAAVVTVRPDPEVAQELLITATNRFDLGSLALTKKVTGDAAGYVGDRGFTLAVTCVLDQGGPVPTPVLTAEKHTLTGGQTVQIDELPIGASCWAEESDAGGATSTSIDHDSAATAVTVTEGATATLTAVNTFDGAELVVSKQVVNGPVGPYTFSLECNTSEGAVTLRDSDAEFRLRKGEKRTILVPLGAKCVVTELKVRDGDQVTYQGSTGKKNGSIQVTGNSSVRVTNTFLVKPGDSDESDENETNGTANGSMPGTGGPSWWTFLLGGGLLMAGAAVLGASLRRARRGVNR